MQSESILNRSEGMKPWLVLTASCLGTFLSALDVTLMGVAIPSIQREFELNLIEVSWVLNAYTLVFAALVIVGGKLGDIFGRKRLLLLGFLIFGLGSLMGGLVVNLWGLYTARVVQGIGAAMMMPGSLAVLTEAFHRRGLSLAIGIWSGVAGLGLIVGPFVSGGIISLFAWRAIFLLNLPIVAVAILTTWLRVNESRDTTIDRRVDFIGVLLSAGIIVLLVMGINGGNIFGWTAPQTLGIFVGALLLITLFAVAEVNSPFPIIEQDFFKSRAFVVGAAVRFSAGFAFVPVVLMSTLYLQSFLHKSAFEAGILFLPAGVVVVVSTAFWGRVVDKIGPKAPMIFGMIIAGVGSIFWVRFGATSGYLALLPSLLLAGFGGSAAFVSTTFVAVNSLSVNKAGVASGIINMVQNVSSALGVASVSAIFLHSLRSGLVDTISGVDYQRIQAFGPDAGNIAQSEAFVSALSSAATVIMVVLFLGVAVALFLPKMLSSPQTIKHDLLVNS